jgi:glycosyltransferase involved in cell wall biosynthesis
MAAVRSLSFVIPVFNEERALPDMLRAARAWLEARGEPWEIVVVDNASTDATVERAEEWVDGERVRVLRNPANRGKGYSIRRGMLEATGDLRLMCDADCQVSLASLPRMLELARDADVVIGSRVAEGAAVSRQQPLRRRAVGLGILVLCHALLREPARDIFCGFKLFSAPAAEAVFGRVRLEGWTFDVEALALARALGYDVRECGIAWTNRPDSRLTIRREVVPVLRELLAVRRHAQDVRGEAAVGGPLPGRTRA